MRLLNIAMTLVLASAVVLSVSSITMSGTAEAKAHVTKGKPGKCGVGKYYSKKDKGCVNKMMM